MINVFYILNIYTEVRHLKDTRSQLKGNRSEQKQLNEAATHAEMDHQSRQIDHKIQVRVHLFKG